MTHVDDDLVELAKATIASAENGHVGAARRVLTQASIALRDVVDGRVPHMARIEYLRYLLRALDEIASGIKPSKALGLGESNRPKTDKSNRDFNLFYHVGLEYQRLTHPKAERPDKPLLIAQQRIAKRTKAGLATVQKAWAAHGSRRGWRRVVAELEEST